MWNGRRKPETYAALEDVARKLGLDVPLTIYQAQNPQGLNASLAYVPGEAHVVLHGPVSSKLTDAEFRALLAHELSHFLLWRSWDGQYMVTEQILSALTHDPLADTPHFASRPALCPLQRGVLRSGFAAWSRAIRWW